MIRPDSSDSEILFEIGSMLREHRNAAGISQHELASMCGVERKTINRIERGANASRITLIVRIAFALGLSPSEVLK